MLTLTDDARLAIRTLIGPSEITHDAGVRIAATSGSDGAGPELALTLAAEPEPGDQVVDEDGARVFLDPTAAVLLDQQTLDVQVDPAEEQVNFYLT